MEQLPFERTGGRRHQKFATIGQLLACYPQFPEFVKLKQKYDPDDTFQSDWYRHYRRLLAS